MARAKILIPESELRRLYILERWSPAKIGNLFGCDGITVRNRIVEAGIPLKSKSDAQTHFPRNPFKGTDVEKAYMLGFRYGDLNVYKPKGASQTIVVRSHSTKAEQCRVFEEMFKSYGTITTSSNSRTIQMTCYLDLSFEFLLEKYPAAMREWILSNSQRTWSFIAGYIDAEGMFGINQGKARFKIDAYDYEILSDIYQFLITIGLRVRFRVIGKEGENDYGWIWKRDLWRLEINEAVSIERFLGFLKTYLRHEKRIDDVNMVLQNIATRRFHGTIV